MHRASRVLNGGIDRFDENIRILPPRPLLACATCIAYPVAFRRRLSRSYKHISFSKCQIASTKCSIVPVVRRLVVGRDIATRSFEKHTPIKDTISMPMTVVPRLRSGPVSTEVIMSGDRGSYPTPPRICCRSSNSIEPSKKESPGRHVTIRNKPLM